VHVSQFPKEFIRGLRLRLLRLAQKCVEVRADLGLAAASRVWIAFQNSGRRILNAIEGCLRPPKPHSDKPTYRDLAGITIELE